VALFPSVSKKQWPSLAALLFGNCVPLFGALVFHWNVFDIVALYWLENWVIMFFTALRMVIVKPEEPWWMKFFFVPFFMLHFGLFTAGHGVFFALVAGPDEAFILAALLGVLPALLAVFLSHGISFVEHFLMSGDWKKKTSVRALMIRPYRRVVVMHLTVMVGVLFTILFPSTLILPIVLILFKTTADAWAHLSVHSTAQADE
jgi:hypothetical protein